MSPDAAHLGMLAAKIGGSAIVASWLRAASESESTVDEIARFVLETKSGKTWQHANERERTVARRYVRLTLLALLEHARKSLPRLA